jgi:hypothetical protein
MILILNTRLLLGKKMNVLLSQIIFARNDDVENWMNILFVVILMVFWALGGILKARAKNVKEESEEPQSDKPARKQPQTLTDFRNELFKHLGVSHPSGPSSSRQYRRQIEQPRRRITRPQPTSLSIGTEKKLISVPTEEERSKFTSEPVIELKDKETATHQETPGTTAFAFDSILDFTDTDDLRKAIIHYEILGKPLSLRNPGEHII